MNKVSVILPALNDDESVNEIKPKLLALNIVDEIIVDDTTGLGKAVGSGIARAKNETVCVMDCDGMHPIETMKQMIEVYFATLHRPLLVNGSRLHWNRDVRGVLSMLGNWLVRTLLRLNVKDCTTGFFVGDRSELLSLPQSIWSGYGDFAFALHKAISVRDWRIIDVSFEEGLRSHGRTHTNVRRETIRYLRRILTLLRSRTIAQKVIVPYSRNRIALAVTKSLAKAGYEVYTADSIELAMARYSRYSRGNMSYPDPNTKVSAFIDWVVNKMNNGFVVFPTFTEFWKVKEYGIMGYGGFDWLMPNWKTIKQANNKYEVHKLCLELGIPTPKTEYIKDGVLKKLDGRGALGQSYVSNMLLQERVYGDAIGVGMLFNRGTLRAKFAWKRLSEYPEDGGMSIVRESIYAPKQEAYAEKLLSALNWHGVAMVEFKGEHVLEINPRFWGSLALAIDSGVDFPKLLMDIATKGDCEAVVNWEVGVRTSWLAGCILRRTKPLGNLEDFSIKDPLPFFAQFLTVLYNAVRGKGIVLDERR